MHLRVQNSHGEWILVIIKDVHWVQGAKNILLSAASPCKKGCRFNLDKIGVEWILPLGDTLSWRNLGGKAYLMPCKVEEVATVASTSTTSQTLIEWHRALAHASAKTIWKAECTSAGIGLNLKGDKLNMPACESCIIGNAHQQPFQTITSTQRTLQTSSCWIWDTPTLQASAGLDGWQCESMRISATRVWPSYKRKTHSGKFT